MWAKKKMFTLMHILLEKCITFNQKQLATWIFSSLSKILRFEAGQKDI